MTTRIKTTPETQLYNINEVIYKKQIENLQKNKVILFNRFLTENFKMSVTNRDIFENIGDNIFEVYEILKLIKKIDTDIDFKKFVKMRYRLRNNLRLYDFENFCIIVKSLETEKRKLAEYTVDIENIQVRFQPKKYIEPYIFNMDGIVLENEIINGYHFLSKPIQKVIWSKDIEITQYIEPYYFCSDTLRNNLLIY